MNSKPYLRVTVMEGMEMVPKVLHIYSTDGTTAMLSFSTHASLIMPTMWNFSWWKTIHL